jgi:hypothetical protein
MSYLTIQCPVAAVGMLQLAEDAGALLGVLICSDRPVGP